MGDEEFKQMEEVKQIAMVRQFQRIFQRYFIEKESEAGVYYPGTFLMGALIDYEKQMSELYQFAAEQFKKFKGPIKSLGLTYQKFDKLVDKDPDLPRSDANTKYNAFSSDSKSKKIIKSKYGFSENR